MDITLATKKLSARSSSLRNHLSDFMDPREDVVDSSSDSSIDTGWYEWKLFCACRKLVDPDEPVSTIKPISCMTSSSLKSKGLIFICADGVSDHSDEKPKPPEELVASPDKASEKNDIQETFYTGLNDKKGPLKNNWGKLKKKVKTDQFQKMKDDNSMKNNATVENVTGMLMPFVRRNLGCNTYGSGVEDEPTEQSQNEESNNLGENEEAAATENNMVILPCDHMCAGQYWYRVLACILSSPSFQKIIMMFIMFSTVVLAIDTPTSNSIALEKFVGVSDVIFTIIFTLEALLKILVLGFYGFPDAYLNDGWNALDFLVVVTSLLSAVFRSELGEADTFRALRAFRPLRLLSKNEGMRVVMNALLRSLPAMVNVLAVMILVWLIFSIIAVQLFGGKFQDCYISESNDNIIDFVNDRTYSGMTDHQYCVNVRGGVWRNGDTLLQFDSVPVGMLTLFVVSTLEGWVEIMWKGMDVTEKDMKPRLNNTKYSFIFFFTFILIGSFFFISLFVGVVFDNFVKLRDEEMGLGLLTDTQKNWVQTQMMIIKAQPVIIPQPPGFKKINKKNAVIPLHTPAKNSIGPNELNVFPFPSSNMSSPSFASPATPSSAVSSPQCFGSSRNIGSLSPNLNMKEGKLSTKEDEHWRMKFYRITLNETFEKLIMACIMINVMIMCFERHNPNDWETSIHTILDFIFTVIFTVEMTIKLLGLGLRQYFTDHWNKFDFIVVIGGWLNIIVFDMFLKNRGVNVDISMLRIIRLFRVSRLIRLVKSLQRLKTLLRTLIISLPSLANVGALLALMYAVFSILGMQMFHSKHLPLGSRVYMDEHNNFSNFPRSISVLFRVSTGEDWQGIMSECCLSGGSVFAFLCPLYFVIFYIVVSFVTLNLFIAIIIDNFAIVAVAQEQNVLMGQKLTEEMVANFTDAWAILDPKATKFILHTDFPDLLRMLDKPIGVGKSANHLAIWRFLSEIMVPIHDGTHVHYAEVLFALSERLCGTHLPGDTKIFHNLHKQLKRKLPQYGKSGQVGLRVMLAVLKCQRLWRAKILKRKLHEIQEQNIDVEEKRNKVRAEIRKSVKHLISIKNLSSKSSSKKRLTSIGEDSPEGVDRKASFFHRISKVSFRGISASHIPCTSVEGVKSNKSSNAISPISEISPRKDRLASGSITKLNFSDNINNKNKSKSNDNNNNNSLNSKANVNDNNANCNSSNSSNNSQSQSQQPVSIHINAPIHIHNYPAQHAQQQQFHKDSNTNNKKDPTKDMSFLLQNHLTNTMTKEGEDNSSTIVKKENNEENLSVKSNSKKRPDSIPKIKFGIT